MRAAWQMWRGDTGFNEETINAIVDAGIKNAPKDASIGNTNGEKVMSQEIRTSKVSWLTHEQWIRDALFEFIKTANKNAFNVDVENFADLQYTEYHASEGGHYGWHEDVFWGEEDPHDRKLSVTVQLSDKSDYDGGDFEFQDVETPEDSKKKGTVLVFPSYHKHRVAPVTIGVRKSLVAWFQGPRWR